MTWVVGAPTMFGYGIGISDVRVTTGDGYHHDCLQKIYPVGRFMAMGFAGSVRVGFAMIEELSSLLGAAPENQMWNPNDVAQWWPEDARQVFERFSPKEKSAHSHLMMVSAFPNLENKDAPFSRAFVHIFKSPNFLPVSVRPRKLGAIGCGTAIESCQNAVDELSSNHESMSLLMQGEVGCPGGMGSVLGLELTKILQRTQPQGISAHLHYCWVYCEKVIVKTNDHWAQGRWSTFSIGSGINDVRTDERRDKQPAIEDAGSFVMPQIATSWEQLEHLLKVAGARADGCIG